VGLNDRIADLAFEARHGSMDAVPMRINCISIVRDEVDILGHTLNAALAWAHAIYVCDNDSTDGTWELLQEYARRYPQITLLERHSGIFSDSLRGDLVNQLTTDARNIDWWSRLDADEIHVLDPRAFLNRINSAHSVVYSTFVEYFFTDLDLAVYEDDPDRYVAEWTPSVPKYYLARWSEQRFVRHQPGKRWAGAWPAGFDNLAGAPERLITRHFQYRTPPQIQRRVRNRLTFTKEHAFLHEKAAAWSPTGRAEDICFRATGLDQPRWRSRVVRANALHFDDGSGRFHIDSDLLPQVQTRPSALARTAKSMAKRVRKLRKLW
jgi:glycosyltransferase involved in cell wall biosynthesis